MPVKAHEASEYLRTPEDVAAYLNGGAVEQSDGDPRLLMKAFRNVAAAQGAFPPSLGEPTWIAWLCPVGCRGAGTPDWER